MYRDLQHTRGTVVVRIHYSTKIRIALIVNP
jgi:hypothetical protein